MPRFFFRPRSRGRTSFSFPLPFLGGRSANQKKGGGLAFFLWAGREITVLPSLPFSLFLLGEKKRGRGRRKTPRQPPPSLLGRGEYGSNFSFLFPPPPPFSLFLHYGYLWFSSPFSPPFVFCRYSGSLPPPFPPRALETNEPTPPFFFPCRVTAEGSS